MKRFTLKKDELETLKQALKSEHYKRSAYKINAVLLLGSGWTLEEVKNALFLDDETLSGYVKDYQEGGLSLLLRVNYKGSDPYLSMSQIEILHDELNGKIHLTPSLLSNIVRRHLKFRIPKVVCVTYYIA
jgi:transposase